MPDGTERPGAPDGVLIRPMRTADADEVLAVYQAGLDTGLASFETVAPTWEAFDAGKLPRHRYVAADAATGWVVGWVAAFVYDTADGAAPTIDLLEYANSQLLEFRHYDEVLTGVLADVYKRLEKKRRWFARWSLVTQAEQLNTLRLDYQEVVERTENAIKFLSDMFYARVYRLAASRIGVPDYRNLVNAKLSDARDLYESLVNEFHQSRAFVLEVLVVVILLIEIGFLFRGKG